MISILVDNIGHFVSKSCFYDLLWLSVRFTSDSEQIWSIFKIFVIMSSLFHHVIISQKMNWKCFRQSLMTFYYHIWPFKAQKLKKKFGTSASDLRDSSTAMFIRTRVFSMLTMRDAHFNITWHACPPPKWLFGANRQSFQ